MKEKKPDGSTYVCSTWGYVMEKSNGKWVRQHRLLVERSIGRKLTKGEVVHHLDGDRANNNLDNLKLMSDYDHRSLHSSQVGRHSDQTRLKMSISAMRIASSAEERQRRSDRAKVQHMQGRFGVVSNV